MTEARLGIDAKRFMKILCCPCLCLYGFPMSARPMLRRRGITSGRIPTALIRVNLMDIRKNKALWIVGQILLVSLALAVMAGGWIVIGTG